MLGKPGSPPEIWMTQIQYMNDHKEWWHAYELIREPLRALSTDSRDIIRNYAKYWIDAFDLTTASSISMAFHRVFVLSVSEEPDLLSQWRGYTPDGGYCIEFSPGALAGIATKNNLELRRCVYDDQEKKSVINQLFDSIIQDLTEGVVSDEIRSTVQDRTQQVISTAGLKMQRAFSEFACYFKHASFREEKEWRLTGAVPAGGGDSRERWRTRGNVILPYAAIPLSDSMSVEPAIRGVIVGPNIDFQLAEHSIRFVTYGRKSGLSITQSKSTLRR